MPAVDSVSEVHQRTGHDKYAVPAISQNDRWEYTSGTSSASQGRPARMEDTAAEYLDGSFAVKQKAGASRSGRKHAQAPDIVGAHGASNDETMPPFEFSIDKRVVLPAKHGAGQRFQAQQYPVALQVPQQLTQSHTLNLDRHQQSSQQGSQRAQQQSIPSSVRSTYNSLDLSLIHISEPTRPY